MFVHVVEARYLGGLAVWLRLDDGVAGAFGLQDGDFTLEIWKGDGGTFDTSS